MEKDKINNIIVEDIDKSDYPDFCDAYIGSADYNGKSMTDEQLEEINEDAEFVYNCIINQLF